MMRIKRCFDVEQINDILKQPSIACFVNDDASRGHKVADAEHSHWIGVYQDDVCVGVFLLVQHNCATVEMHTALMIKGSKALQAARLLMQYVFSNYFKLVTQVPENNRMAKLMALRLGFVVEGINRKSFLLDGKLYNQDILGITKEEYESCH